MVLSIWFVKTGMYKLLSKVFYTDLPQLLRHKCTICPQMYYIIKDENTVLGNKGSKYGNNENNNILICNKRNNYN